MIEPPGPPAASRTATRIPRQSWSGAALTLVTACVAHALHDGFTDSLYVFLPVWQTVFGLNYAALAALRGLYVGTMAGLQIPSGRIAGRIGAGTALVLGTVLASVGYALAGLAGGELALFAALVIGGAGSSTQHPQASALVARAYGSRARGPLGTYNFAGDLGKAALPALASVLVTVLHWRAALWILAALGLATAGGIRLALPAGGSTGAAQIVVRSPGQSRGGFPLLFAVGVLDSAVRMGFLTFLPFLLKPKGATLPEVGAALAAVFIGGAAGKFAFGWLGARIGLLLTVIVTEGGTFAAIVAVLFLPLTPIFFVLPVLGLMLNGTSSVLYGTVPELAGDPERAFAVFYTGTIGSGALAPVLYGVLADVSSANWAMLAAAATALPTIPLAALVARRFTQPPG